MKKIIVILAVLIMTTSVWGIEKPCKKPCDIENADSLTVDGPTTIEYNDLKFNHIAGHEESGATSPLTLTDDTGGGSCSAPPCLLDSTEYCYGFTYVTADGETQLDNVSNFASSEGRKVTTSAGTAADDHCVTVSTIPVHANSRVTGRKIYRSDGACVSPHEKNLIATISDNTTTSVEDCIASGAVGALQPTANTTGGTIYAEDGTTPTAKIGAENTTYGLNSGLNSAGLDNTFFGYRAGESTAGSIGKANTGFGSGVGLNITSGSSNLLFGSSAGGVCTTCDQNAFMGSHSGGDCTTCAKNVFIGATTGSKVIDHTNNVGIGTQTLQDCGNEDPTATTPCDQNTFIGSTAGQSSQNSNGSVAIGYAAGFNLGDDGTYNFPEGWLNTIIGTQAGYNETGAYNVYIGKDSAKKGSIARGDNNVYLGYQSGENMSTSTNSIIIGSNACGTVANCGVGRAATDDYILWIDSGNGNAEIAGTPIIGGDMSGNILNFGGAVVQNYTATAEADGAVAVTVAEMAGRLITHNNTSGAVAATLDTAANIVGAIPFCSVNSGFDFYYRNKGTATVTLTQDGGATTTIDGDSTATITTGQTRHFMALVTNCGTPAVTVYSLGASTH